MTRGSSRRRLVVAVKPHAGLGNRVRAVLSGECLADETGREFAYCWPTGRPFGARLDELWQYGRPVVAPLPARALALRYPVRDASVGWRDAATDDRLWFIRTGQPLPTPSGELGWPAKLRALRPTPELAERIVACHDEHLRGRRYVGVMVRAHQVSHAKSQQASPVDWFVRRMTEIRAQDPDVGFFLSCDVPEVQRDLVARFPGTVGLTDKGGYNTGAALQSAVVDLYLLAGSGHILGPHYSSFPELAHFLAGGRVALETSMTEPVHAWEHDAQRVRTVAADPLVPSIS